MHTTNHIAIVAASVASVANQREEEEYMDENDNENKNENEN